MSKARVSTKGKTAELLQCRFRGDLLTQTNEGPMVVECVKTFTAADFGTGSALKVTLLDTSDIPTGYTAVLVDFKLNLGATAVTQASAYAFGVAQSDGPASKMVVYWLKDDAKDFLTLNSTGMLDGQGTPVAVNTKMLRGTKFFKLDANKGAYLAVVNGTGESDLTFNAGTVTNCAGTVYARFILIPA